MQRLCFIKKRFSPHGGAENYLKTLLDRLREHYEITILSNSWSPAEGIRFQKVPVSNLGSFLSTTSFNDNVYKALKRSSYDCVISFERTACQDVYRAGEGCHAEWLERRSRIEPVLKNLSFRVNPLHRALLSLEKELFSSTGLIIANSLMVKKQIIKHYAVPDKKIAVIYNGVDLDRFSPENRNKWRKSMRAQLSIAPDMKVLLFVGSGFKRKGLETLVRALPLIEQEDIKVLVVGKGNAKTYTDILKKHGLSEKVVFLGPQKEIERFYAAADVFVLPTLYDPFSNATVEAMASGLPTITTSGNGVAEIIENGKEGYITEDFPDEQALAQRIMFSLEDHITMGERAREKAERFPIQKAASAFAQVIQQATGRGTLSAT